MNANNVARKALAESWGVPWRMIGVRIVRVRKRRREGRYLALLITLQGVGSVGWMGLVTRKMLIQDVDHFESQIPTC